MVIYSLLSYTELPCKISLPFCGLGLGGGGCVGFVRRTGKKNSCLCSRDGRRLSNNVLKVDFSIGHIFAKNRTQAKAIIHGFFMIWDQN